MENLTEVQRELFERVIWEMDSNIEILEYHLDRLDQVNDPFIDNFKQRLIGLANAISEFQPQSIDITF